MKHIYHLLFLICLTFPICAFADAETDSWLKKLDKSLAQRDQFEQKRISRINDFKKELSQLDKQKNTDKYYDLLYGLYNEYKSYCYDSAHHYAYECLNVAQADNNEERIVQAKNAIAFSLISAGILSEANEVLKSIDRSKLSGQLLSDYYEHNSQLWRSQADYVREEPFYTKYITQSNAYLDSLMKITPKNSARWWSFQGSRQMRDRQYPEALESFNKVLAQCDSDLHVKAMTTAEMAWAYIFLDDENKAKQYFAQSAIYDNETASTSISFRRS